MRAGDLAAILAEHPEAELEFSVEPELPGDQDGRIYAQVREGETHVLVRDGPNGPVHLVAVMLSVTSTSGVRITFNGGSDGG